MKFRKFAVIAAAAALVACLGLAGCGGGGDQGGEEPLPNGGAVFKVLNEGQLTVATSPDFPPFENLVNGEYVGLEMDIMKAISERMGLEFNPITLQFDGIVPAIAAGGQADCAISGITITPERAEQVDFSAPYYVDDLAIVVMNNGEITEANVDQVLAQAGAVIAVQSGTTGESYAKETYSAATVQGYGNANDTFAAMQAGQANAVITNKAVAESMLGSYADATIVKPIATGEEYGIAVSKDNPELLAGINAAIADLQADGTIASLTTQWMSAPVE